MQAICLDGLSSAYDSVNLPTLVESVRYASHLSKLLDPVLKAGSLSMLVEPVGDAASLCLCSGLLLTASPRILFSPSLVHIWLQFESYLQEFFLDGTLNFLTSYSNLFGRGWLWTGRGVDVGHGDIS